MTDPREQQQEMLKKFLKNHSKIEAVLLSIVVVAIIIRPSVLGAGSLLLIISLSTLAMVNIFKSFEEIKEFNHSNEIFVKKINGLGAAVAIIGILFRLLNWPGSNQMLIVGSVSMLAVVIMGVLLIAKYKEKSIITYKNLIKSLLILAVGATLLLTPWHILKKNKIVFETNVDNKEQVDSTKNK